MATKTKRHTTKHAGRARRSRGGNPKPGGPGGLLNQITGRLGRSGGRRGAGKGGGSLASKASGFVGGFLSGGGKSGRRRR